MKYNLLRLRILGVIFIYLLASLTTVVDKLPFVNDWNLGINQEYWGSNGAFLASVSFWFNMFLYSILLVIIAKFSINDKVIIYSSLALPLFWGFFLFRSITDTGSSEEVFIPNMKYFVYGILFSTIGLTLMKLILIIRSLRTEKTIDNLEQFQERALQKLNRLNPEHNQQLLEDVMGDHGHALNLLIASHYYEDDEEKQKELTRLALHYAMKEKDALRQLEKRMLRYAKAPE